MSLFYVSIFTSLRINEGYTISKAITNIFEVYPFNEYASKYNTIQDKKDLNEFIYNLMLNKIFNDDSKDYVPMMKGYHYLNYYNYFMGLRITYNRAKLSK